jgi:glutaredoxin
MPTPTTAAMQVTYVTAPACHYCDHGRAVLAELAERVPLEVREVSLDSEEGRQLLAVHRFAFPPAVIVDGRLIAHGRLSARRLARLLPLEVG